MLAQAVIINEDMELRFERPWCTDFKYANQRVRRCRRNLIWSLTLHTEAAVLFSADGQANNTH
jgi:hypothetical protein